jgi:hypothetical protein
MSQAKLIIPDANCGASRESPQCASTTNQIVRGHCPAMFRNLNNLPVAGMVHVGWQHRKAPSPYSTDEDMLEKH